MKFIAIICLFLATVATAEVCPRPAAGSEVQPPAEIVSINGRLETTLYFRTQKDTYDQTRYCYVSDHGELSPALRVNRGDTVILHLKNEANALTNVHFHGLNIAPVLHQDDVLRTLIKPGETFDYRFQVPTDQPPGLYWYHPHVHGLTEEQVLGGASGALIVNGPRHGLERSIILRDQVQPGDQLNYMEPGEESEKDVSINFVPVIAPLYTPAVIPVEHLEFWRVLNAAADTYFDLQIVGRKGVEPVKLTAMDGVPLQQAAMADHVLIPPGGRAEFQLALKAGAQLTMKRYETGQGGEITHDRVLANLVLAPWISDYLFEEAEPGTEDLRKLTPIRTRKLYLSEDRDDLIDPTSIPKYYITEEGKQPKLFDMMATEPDITVEQGTVEDWIIENRAREVHTFHIHQLHFQVLNSGVLRDTIELPYWDGKGPYPSVTLRMDFRSPLIIGDFVYHCHILEHEDNGMMGRIRVVHGK